MKILYKSRFYELTDLNIKVGAALLENDLYLFNPSSLQICRLVDKDTVSLMEISPLKKVEDISDLRYQECLRPRFAGANE